MDHFKDQLTTTDQQGKRHFVFPASVRGRYHSIRVAVHAVLILLFLSVPWITVGGHPLLQLDVPHRRFYFFGHLFLPQDAPGIVFVLATFVVSMGLLTALFGRAWCGWACPQTVFIENVFRRLEIFVEGDHLARRKLDSAEWNFEKISKRFLKWSLFLAVSLVITHSFLAYFVGGKNVLQMMTLSPSENPGSFFLVVLSTAVIVFDFGWFREQFCLIACPYGRFQSILHDPGSLTIAYDVKRGEPRRALRSAQSNARAGDCIACGKCVQVCPTGIDIRNGFQMECIACTACADACDSVMTKIGRPQGLIRYESESGFRGKREPWYRGRVLVYFALLAISVGGLVYRIKTHEVYQIEVLRSVTVPYQSLKDPSGKVWILNHFKANFYNLSAESWKTNIATTPRDADHEVEILQSEAALQLESGDRATHSFILKFPASLLEEGKKTIHLESASPDGNLSTEVHLVGPGSGF